MPRQLGPIRRMELRRRCSWICRSSAAPSSPRSLNPAEITIAELTQAYPGWDAATDPTGAPPTINSFAASATTVAVGTPVTLTWSTTNDSYDFIDKLGGVRGGSVTFTPTATTTYTLNSTNQYGRSTSQVTVVVQ